MAEGETNQRFLLVKHSRGWDVDRCCQWMKKYSVDFDICYPADGDNLPELERYTAIISFGGACSANDCTTLPWVRKELDYIEQCLHLDKAFFGICLGAQMLARVLGSTVARHPNELKEVGYHLINPTAESGDFLVEPKKMMQWHSEGFDLPKDCALVATSDYFPNQAFRYSHRVFGVQFHPEVNPEALGIWHGRNARRETGSLTQQERDLQMQDALKHDQDITNWLDDFLHSWSGQPRT